MTTTTTTAEGESDGVVEVEFTIANPDYPIVNISNQTGCTAELEQLLPRGNGKYTVFYRVTGATPDQILSLADACDDVEATLISEGTEDALYEVHLGNEKEFFVVTLIDAGAIPRQVTSADGEATIVADIPTQYSASAVIDRVCTTHPAMEVVARRQQDYDTPVFSQSDFQSVLEQTLTCRQHQVLVAAFAGGYFHWPRKKSGEEIADELGISAPTFTQHLRVAQEKLLSLLFTV